MIPDGTGSGDDGTCGDRDGERGRGARNSLLRKVEVEPTRTQGQSKTQTTKQFNFVHQNYIHQVMLPAPNI